MELEKLKHSSININENIEISWAILKSNWKTFLKIIVFIAIPSFILSAFSISGFLLIPFISLDLLLIASIFSAILIAESTIENKELNLRKVVFKSANNIITILIGNFFASLFAGIGSLFFIIPGIYFATNFVFINQAILLRNCHLSALDYSANLVKKDWWRVFLHFLSIGTIFMILSLLTTVPVALSLSFFDFFIIILISRIVSGICSLLVAYFFMISLTVLFFNLEYVKGSHQNETQL